jgi:hypothetical protein
VLYGEAGKKRERKRKEGGGKNDISLTFLSPQPRK